MYPASIITMAFKIAFIFSTRTSWFTYILYILYIYIYKIFSRIFSCMNQCFAEFDTVVLTVVIGFYITLSTIFRNPDSDVVHSVINETYTRTIPVFYITRIHINISPGLLSSLIATMPRPLLSNFLPSGQTELCQREKK